MLACVTQSNLPAFFVPTFPHTLFPSPSSFSLLLPINFPQGGPCRVIHLWFLLSSFFFSDHNWWDDSFAGSFQLASSLHLSRRRVHAARGFTVSWLYILLTNKLYLYCFKNLPFYKWGQHGQKKSIFYRNLMLSIFHEFRFLKIDLFHRRYIPFIVGLFQNSSEKKIVFLVSLNAVHKISIVCSLLLWLY